MKKYILIILLLVTTSAYATVTPGNIARVRTGGILPSIQDSVMLQYNNNIGIGSATPGTKVDVTGTVRATSFTGDGSGITGIPGASNYWSLNAVGINTTTNVGLGTTLSSSKLEIIGGGIKAEQINKTWETILQDPGLTTAGVTFEEVNSMAVYKHELYLGYNINSAGNLLSTCKVYKWNGSVLTYLSTIGSGVHFQGVTFLQPYNGLLYAGVQGSVAGDGDIYVSSDSGLTWTKSFDGPDNFAYSALVFKGNLYVGTGFHSPIEVLKFDGTSWTTAFSYGSGITGLVTSLIGSQGKMFAATGGTNAQILSSPDGANWTAEVSYPAATYTEINHIVEFRGNLYANVIAGVSGTNDLLVRNKITGTWSVAIASLPGSNQCWGMNVYNDALYIGCTNIPDGAYFVKTYDGATYTVDFQPNTAGLQFDYEAFKMINYNGSLYVGMGGKGLLSANLWRRTDSTGQQFDLNNSFIKHFRYESPYSDYKFGNDNYSIGISSPATFDTNVGIGTTVDAASASLVVSDHNVGVGTFYPGAAMIVVSGNVGIGSRAPSSILDVTGTIKTTGLQLNLAPLSGGNVLVSNSVGVGTWMSPSTLPTGAGGSGTVNAGLATFYGRYPSDGTTIDDSAVTMDDGTNVGIGTTTPLAKLNINTSANQDLFRVDDSAGTDATPFIIDSTGNVGIGTATPLAILSVSSTSNQTLVRVDDNGNGDLSPFIIDANGNVGIGTTNTERDLLLVMGGNVGIGTWVPSTALDVKGTIVANGFQLSNNGAASGNVLVGNSIGLGTWMAASTLPISGGSGYATIQDETTPLTQRSTVNFTGSGVSCADNGGTSTTDCTINSGGGSSQWITQAGVGIGTTDKVGIGTTLMGNAGLTVMNGNVGIGTWNPGQGLDVLGNARILTNLGIGTTSPGIALSVGNGSFTANSSGAVFGAGGITSTTAGTTATQNQFSANSITSGTIFVVSSTNSTSALTGDAFLAFLSGVNNNGNVIHAQQLGNGKVVLFDDQSGDQSPFQIDSTGNVGIGTTSPNGKVGVVGNIGISTNFNSNFITTLPPNGGMIIEGNVGIGTVNPGVILDINGATRISNSGDSYFGGNIGIGTTIPMASLAVQGGAAIGTVTYTGTAVPSGNLVVSGNVGIGTQNPGTVLDVKGTGAKLRMQSPDGTLWNCQPVNTTGVFTCT